MKINFNKNYMSSRFLGISYFPKEKILGLKYSARFCINLWAYQIEVVLGKKYYD